MYATGFKATVSSGDGRSISRTSFHPTDAESKLMEWVNKQIAFAQAHKFEISWTIESIEGKTIEKFGA